MGSPMAQNRSPDPHVQALPDEIAARREKFERSQEAVLRQEGSSATEGALAIARQRLPEIADAVRAALAPHSGRSAHPEFYAVIRDVGPEVLALCILRGALHSVGQSSNCRDTELYIGGLIADECWARGLTEERPILAEHVNYKARQNTSASEHSKKYARTLAERYGYKGKAWNNELLARAGSWAINILLERLPDVFTIETGPAADDKGNDDFLTLTDEAQTYIATLIEQLIEDNPVWRPRPEPPRPWRGWNEGGTWDKRLARTLTVMRSRREKTQAAVQEAIRDGNMKPALNALNALQSVPWAINARVLEVLRECVARRIKISDEILVAELVPSAPPRPPKGERLAAWKIQQEEIEKARRQLKSDSTLFAEDMQTAERMAAYERFYTALNLDFRGRINGVPSFNFQRSDRVRGLFLFADGEPIGDKGLYWLKTHVANCGDSRISKRPFAERIAWVDEHWPQIEAVAADPVTNLWWTGADKPCQFLAACLELTAAVAEGPNYKTRLPVAFDGSCSGLQHLCAMTRSEEGAQVNLTRQTEPQDIYQTIADQVRRRVEADLTNEENREMARMCLDWIWDQQEPARARETLKRNVMTYAYSSTFKGMADQLIEDTMAKLARQVTLGELEEHPFGPGNGRSAAHYLAKHAFTAIKQTVERPAKAMTFLRKLVGALAAEQKHLCWISPAGIPVINSYTETETKRVHLWMNKRGVRVRGRTKLAMADDPKIKRSKAQNAVTPNFVHACDAAHLMLTVNAAVSEGITSIATVHDCFSCLPSRAERFREIIREQFVRMYKEHDVLAKVFEQARADLGDKKSKRMPKCLPPYGDLDIEQMRDAEYAFA